MANFVEVDTLNYSPLVLNTFFVQKGLNVREMQTFQRLLLYYLRQVTAIFINISYYFHFFYMPIKRRAKCFVFMYYIKKQPFKNEISQTPSSVLHKSPSKISNPFLSFKPVNCIKLHSNRLRVS